MVRFATLVLVVVSFAACDDALVIEQSEASRPNAVAQARPDAVDAVGPGPDVVGDTTTPVTPDTTDTTGTAETADSTGTPDIADAPDTSDTGPDTEVMPDTSLTDIDTTPDVGPAPTGQVQYPGDRIHSPIPAVLAERLREIAAIDPALVDDVFMKVGASSFVQNSFLKCFAGNFDLDAYSHLEPARAFFAAGVAADTNPFSRVSLAAKSGVNAGWAIAGDPSPMESEYLAVSPRFAFVMYGANDMGRAGSYEASLWLFGETMWTLVDELLSWGVTPVLMSIGRRIDSPAADRWVQTYNALIRGLAQGRGLPFVDIYQAFLPLPNFGVSSDGLHASVYSNGACVLTSEGLRFGHNMRNRHLLEVLSRLEAVVVDHVPALEGDDLDAVYLTGDGSPATPFLVEQLPFSDLRSTVDSPHTNLDRYSGCASNTNEEGPEYLYRLEVTSRVRIRATVHDLGDTDIDLHLLNETATAGGCLQRNHRIINATLDPGVYHFALDTFVGADGPQSGEYIFTVIDCDAGPPGCL